MSTNNFADEPVRVDKELAIKETTFWRDTISPFMSDPLRGFFIPIADLVAIATEHGVEGMRSYICLVAEGEYNGIHTVVVPVDADGKDILEKYNPETGQMESTIYDLTKPCPHFCDITSDLYLYPQPPAESINQ